MPAVPDSTHGTVTADDLDGDGVKNDRDNCPSVANRNQRDACAYPPAPPRTGEVIADGLARLNWARSLVGLGPVVEDAELTHGCVVHIDYLVAASEELGRPILTHEEDLSKPYASEEGNDAGIDSVISLGPDDIVEGVDGWINTLYHRLPLLHPGLERVGIGFRDSYACMQYRRGTNESARAAFPILWPPPDIVGTDRTFGGDEEPCPTIDDPFSGAECPSSAAIPTLGVNGIGPFADVQASMTRTDTGESVPLYRVYYEGGPTEHEQQGYLDGTVALIPEPGSALDRAEYLVSVDATASGTPMQWRWRFTTSRPYPQDLGCDDMGEHNTFDTPLDIRDGQLFARVCRLPDYYRLGSGGTRTVAIELDDAVGDLDLVGFDSLHMQIAKSDGRGDREEITVPGGSIVEVQGFDGGMGPYLMTVR